MKKIIVLALTLLTSSLSYGQLSYGFHVGISNSQFFSKDEIIEDFGIEDVNVSFDLKRATGLNIGMTLGYELQVNMQIVTGLSFVQKGGGFKVSASDGGDKAEIDGNLLFNTLELPLLFRYKFGENIKFYANAGPYFNYMIGGKANTEAIFIEDGVSETETVSGKIIFKDEPDNYTGDDYYAKDDFKQFSIGAYVGGGIAYPMGKGAIVLDAKYGFGFTDVKITEGEKPDPYYANKFNNIDVTLGYTINF